MTVGRSPARCPSQLRRVSVLLLTGTLFDKQTNKFKLRANEVEGSQSAAHSCSTASHNCSSLGETMRAFFALSLALGALTSCQRPGASAFFLSAAPLCHSGLRRVVDVAPVSSSAPTPGNEQPARDTLGDSTTVDGVGDSPIGRERNLRLDEILRCGHSTSDGDENVLGIPSWR